MKETKNHVRLPGFKNYPAQNMKIQNAKFELEEVLEDASLDEEKNLCNRY